jgi:hypothetical protein
MAAGGCAMFGKKEPGTTAELSDVGLASGGESPAKDRGQDALLTAVDEFLERTRDYQTSDPHATDSADRTASRSTTERDVPSPPVVVGERTPGLAVPDSPHSAGAVANSQVALSASNTGSPNVHATRAAVPVIASLSVRPVMEPSAPPASSVRTNTVNEPLSTNHVEAFSIVDRFLQYAEERTKEAPGFESYWRWHLVQLALDQPIRPEMNWDDAPPNTRDMLTHFVRVAEEIRRLARLPDQDRDQAIAAVDALRGSVSDGAPLTIPTVALCRKVLTYGVFEPMAPETLVAGRVLQTIVYIELAHFHSERVDDSTFRTRVRTELELFTPDGRSVWRHEEPEIVDECRRRRSDFFIAQRVSFPPTLSAGDYIMKVRVEDQTSSRLAEGSLPVTLTTALSAGRTP